jgi:hypothetical protein
MPALAFALAGFFIEPTHECLTVSVPEVQYRRVIDRFSGRLVSSASPEYKKRLNDHFGSTVAC